MVTLQSKSKTLHITLWLAQALLAATLLMGAALKFMPIDQISVMMPWMGQVPVWKVRALGIIDLLGAVGLILPTLLRIKPVLTPLAAVSVMVLMLCAIAFHVSRGEASGIGINIFSGLLAVYVGWGRFRKVPVLPKVR